MPSPGLVARLSRARYSIERLRRIAKLSFEEFISDRDGLDVAERNLHILLEAILDLSAYIASKRGLARITSYRGLIQAMIENKVIPKEYASLALMIPGMRNILVHGYADVKYDMLYETITRDLEALARILGILQEEAKRLDP